MWVTSVACAGCATNNFDPASSTTYTTDYEPEHLYYGQGECAGVLSYDSAGISADGQASFPKQAFILVNEENDFGGSGFDGILVRANSGTGFQ